ncbi:MAG: hypothetical protein RLZZ26_173 [Candidatus Parcubacteria bacterium]|jgi:hypothetical protein
MQGERAALDKCVLVVLLFNSVNREVFMKMIMVHPRLCEALCACLWVAVMALAGCVAVPRPVAVQQVSSQMTCVGAVLTDTSGRQACVATWQPRFYLDAPELHPSPYGLAPRPQSFLYFNNGRFESYSDSAGNFYMCIKCGGSGLRR